MKEIYKITNIINGKIYIGQSTINAGNQNYFGSGLYINFAIKKYGKENFIKEIIDIAETKDELDEKEKFWIKKLNTQDHNVGYNISNGGQGGCIINNLHEHWVIKHGEVDGDKKYDEYKEKLKGKSGEKSARYVFINMSDTEVIDMYNDGFSMNHIGKIAKVSKNKIKSILLRNNIKPRDLSDAAKTRPKPSQETKEKMSLSHTGYKNHMAGHSVYDVWLKKYGEDEAIRRMNEYRQNMSIVLKQRNNVKKTKERN